MAVAHDLSNARIEIFGPLPGVVVVGLVGEHDLHTRDDVRKRLFDELRHMTPGDIIVADLTEATFVDSSIIDCLAATERRATELGVHFRLEPGEDASVNHALELTAPASSVLIG